MLKNIKLFANHTAYEAAKNNIDKPNVVMCLQEDEVHYNPIDPYGEHEYVEIGGIKWATMNIGAESETDYGLYFAWADPEGYTVDLIGTGEGQKLFSWDEYEYGYDLHPEYYSDNIHPEHDAANVIWKHGWRMPTSNDFSSLLLNTNYTWETNFNNSGINGGKFTDKSDSSKYVFFPAGGMGQRGELVSVNRIGNYWSSDKGTYGPVNGCYLDIKDNGVHIYYSLGREFGLLIRPVVG